MQQLLSRTDEIAAPAVLWQVGGTFVRVGHRHATHQISLSSDVELKINSLWLRVRDMSIMCGQEAEHGALTQPALSRCFITYYNFIVLSNFVNKSLSKQTTNYSKQLISNE